MKRSREDEPSSSKCEESIEDGKQMIKEASFLHVEVRKHFQGKEREYEDFKETVFDYIANRIDRSRITSKIKELFKGNQDLISLLDSLMQNEYHIIFESFRKTNPQDEAKEFARNIAASFEDPEKTFKDLNRIFRNSKTASDVHQKVSVVFKDKSDLLEQFIHFLPSRYSLEAQSQPVAMVVEEQSKSDIRRKSARLDDRVAKESRRDEGNGGKIDRYLTRKKSIPKPVHELDLSKCERCTPSYHLLPKNHVIQPTSHKTQLKCEVLNEECFLLPSHIANRSFKLVHKSKYEKSLFRCEDDMYELDMLMHSMSAAAERVEEIIESMDSRSNETDGPFRIEDHLTMLHQRTIERLYGEEGLEMMDIVRNNPSRALPVILSRLKKKHEELARCRDEFNEVWSRTIAENHRKSLRD